MKELFHEENGEMAEKCTHFFTSVFTVENMEWAPTVELPFSAREDLS